MTKTISAEWRARRLADVANVIPGFAFKSKDWCKEGIPVIKIKNIVGDLSIDTVDADCVPSDLLTTKLHKFVLNDGDILVAMTGATAGKVGRLRCKRPHLLNQRVAKLAPFDVDPLFFWAVVSSDEYQGRFFKLADGAAQPNMSGGQIEGVELLVPSRNTQRKIAGVLSAYDDLIENNTRRIAILEEMAQSLYREWFVNFRFPGHEKVKLINSSLGKIPEGWKIGVLPDLCRQLTDGTHESPKPTDEGFPLVTGRHLDNGFIAFEKCYLISQEDHDEVMRRCRPESGDIIFSNIGTLGTTVLVDGDREFSVKNVALFKPIDRSHSHFLYLYLSRKETIESMIRRASGTSQKFLSLAFLRNEPILCPPRNVLLNFDDNVWSLLRSRAKLYKKNINLRTTRDLLLPKLISGELDVETLDIDVGEPLAEVGS